MNKLDVQNAILNAMTPYLDDDQLYQLKNTLIEQLYGMNIVEEETRLSVGKRTKICVKKNENLCQKFCAATVAGRGYYQEEGKEAIEMKPGDCINIPAEVKHWHGAAPDSWFSHLAVEVPGEETSNEWCEPVSDEECEKLK